MKRLLSCFLLSSLCVLPRAGLTMEMDVFATARHVASTVAGNLEGFRGTCSGQWVPAPLTVENMIEQVLCQDPQARQSWASAKAQAALTGVEQSAYLPRINGVVGMTEARNEIRHEQSVERSRQARQRQFDNRLELSWVLFDFGRRESALHNARQLLIAANAQHDVHLQEAFVRAAQLYYDALVAQRSLNIARQVAALAAENVKVANARYEAGAAALSDLLQAQTADSQAGLNEVRAEGALRRIKGSIALQMGLPAQTALELSGDLSRLPDTRFANRVDELLEQALLQHPSLVAAKAKVSAAQAAIAQSQAAGRPVLAFTAHISDVQTRQSTASSGDTRLRGNSIGLQLSIPLFDGFKPAYQARRAHADLEANEAVLSGLEQRLSLALWSNYQALKIESRALEKTAQWVDQSRQALHVMQGRYRSGVGSMIELLNALTAYASAEQQHIQALGAWQQVRLQLAGNLGRLGFWAL